MKQKPKASLVRSSAAEYLTFVASSGQGGVEAIYADENVWITQKMLATLYDVDVRTVNYHIKKVFSDSELQEDSVIRNFRITASDGKNYNTQHYNLAAIIAVGYKINNELVEIDERFFRHYFKSADFIKRLSVAVIGIRDGRQISFQDFCSIKLPFPSVDEQKAIAAFLDEAEGEITLLRKYTVLLKTQKRGLMQKLLTGQWRLPPAAGEHNHV